LEICTSASWNSSTAIFSSAPSPRRSARAAADARAWRWRVSISRARALTDRGTQSSERSSSMIEPLIRVIA
jgi:hypothetical protein